MQCKKQKIFPNVCISNVGLVKQIGIKDFPTPYDRMEKAMLLTQSPMSSIYGGSSDVLDDLVMINLLSIMPFSEVSVITVCTN